MTVPFPFIPSSGSLSVQDGYDVRAILPDYAQDNPEDAPVREAICDLITEHQKTYQYRSSYAAAQADVTRATEIYLDGLGEDRGVRRKPGESNLDYRNRIFNIENTVTPKAIIDLVNAILALYTNISAQIFESILDRMFITKASEPSNYHCFLTSRAAGLPITPDYPDRFYAEKGYASPGGAWLFNENGNGRYFVIRIPELPNIQLSQPFFFNESTSNGNVMSFIGDGSNDNNSESTGLFGAFMVNTTITPTDIYNAIIQAVNLIKGQGIRWQLIIDPTLNALDAAT